MESKRQKQTAEVIRRHFGNVLLDQGSYIYGEAFVTITKVQVTPDISLAKIYLSVFNTNDKEGVIEKIRENVSTLKRDLGHRIRKHVRRIPQISFYNDDTLDEMYRLNQLFDKLYDQDQMGQEE
ncbi:MAG: 30S ribosome-binding factor RbfA [Saprospiraceae bacterium]|nr:30S ribosome-binding factor RbfA [Bacteroidia bacterium]NNK89231.1 30S ribosome-binding factor RbfA [Saprospiraceae bacterium]